jgi:Gram-negative bacterial TonB protein C-terminal
MHLTLLESGRSFLQTAECAVLSIVAHAAVTWFAVSATDNGFKLPASEREARVFFLLPPDRVASPERQIEIFQLGKLGSDLENGKDLMTLDQGWVKRKLAHGARGDRDGSGARGKLPFGPMPAYVPDSVFSILQVDEIVQRYPSSAAPIYPKELLAIGAEGLVQATYVVDTVGQVDTTTIKVMYSDDPRFTESVVTALGFARFRPAKRAGKTVRQLVEQKFRFKIMPADRLADPVS